uniref:Uncharacterized protein n=1 Tax=Setaria italica TaxID=4555 RepID=K3Z231_SETIT
MCSNRSFSFLLSQLALENHQERGGETKEQKERSQEEAMSSSSTHPREHQERERKGGEGWRGSWRDELTRRIEATAAATCLCS